MAVAGLLLAPAAALAQSTTSQDTAPNSNSIGPSELQNFSLKGSVTRPADQQPATTPAVRSTDRPAADAPAAARSAVTTHRHDERGVVAREAEVRTATRPPAPKALQPSTSPPPTPDAEPKLAASTPPPQETTSVPPLLTTSPPEPLASEHKLLLWPWLLAAVVIAGAVGFVLWRRRPREALAGGAEFDLFGPPEPTAAPTPPPRRVPEPAPPPTPHAPRSRPAAPTTSGIVSTRLRPQIEISVHPLRCRVDEQELVLDFEIELFNAGAAPARALTAEASLFNAGPTQEQDLAAFFAKPAGLGDRLEVLAPMSRVSFTSQVVARRAAVQEYELAGRKAVVPVIAFNALYTWSGGPAQTSAAYLVGRETKSDKLGPLGVNAVPREFRNLALRALPATLRT